MHLTKPTEGVQVDTSIQMLTQRLCVPPRTFSKSPWRDVRAVSEARKDPQSSMIHLAGCLPAWSGTGIDATPLCNRCQPQRVRSTLKVDARRRRAVIGGPAGVDGSRTRGFGVGSAMLLRKGWRQLPVEWNPWVCGRWPTKFRRRHLRRSRARPWISRRSRFATCVRHCARPGSRSPSGLSTIYVTRR